MDEFANVCHEGQFTSTDVYGYYFPSWYWPGPDPNLCVEGPYWGEFSGSHSSNTGPFSAGAGFYEGTINGEVKLQ